MLSKIKRAFLVYSRLRACGVFLERDYAKAYLKFEFLWRLSVIHYVRFGEKRGYRPHLLFDPFTFRANAGALINSDESLFLQYLEHFSAEAINPSAEFNQKWYSWQNPAWQSNSRHPFIYCAQIGLMHGSDPSPHIDFAGVARRLGLSYPEVVGKMYHMIVQDGSLPAEFATYNAEDLLVKQEEFRKSIVMSFVKLKRKEKRRYLVYVQANRSYKRNAPCVRNYDLLYNYYEKEVSGRGPGYDEAEVVLVQNGTKVTAIDNILRKHPTLMAGYDAVLFLDDDIELNHDNIEKLFEIMSKEKLDLAQASLSEQSFCVWPAFKQPSVSSSNKRVSGVEIMMPCVSQRVLRKFGWVFGETISGFGIDLLLGKLVLEEHGWSAAVIGSVVAEHRKEINETSGAFYNYLRSFGLNQKLELWYMLEKYNLSVDFHYT